ncbi:glutathione S-transferase, partial [Rhizoctonia solani AG-3 Rhs1AP]
MAATKENPVIFYDLVGANGKSWSPNPYKTRLSLNYKGIPYRTEYIAFPDIEPKMKEQEFCCIMFDGTITQIAAVIADPSNNPNGKPTYIADSFKIAIYLDKTYPAPQYPAIFAPGTAGFQHMLMSNYRLTVGASIHPLIHPQMPRILDPRSAEYIHRTRGARLTPLSEDEANAKWKEAQDNLTGLAQSLAFNDETGAVGPFMMGDRVSFADFALAGVFYWIRNVEGPDSIRLKEMFEWDGGRWEKHWKAVEEIENKSSEVV